MDKSTNGFGRSDDGGVAVIFDNFGPYHRARLDAAARLMKVCGIELSGSSSEYAWNSNREAAAWEQYTLFPGESCRTAPRRELGRRIDEVLDRLRPTAVAIPGWGQAGSHIATEWCIRNRVPTVVMSESSGHDEIRRTLSERAKSKLVNLHSAALVGGATHAAYLRSLGVSEGRIFRGYDVIDNRHFAEGAADARKRAEELRRRYNLPENYFLASARFIEKKNIFNLVRAYAAYREHARETAKASPWSLVLLGDGPLAPAIRTLIRELGLEEFVLLPGFRQYPELPAFYGLARAFIHASTTEQWGLVVNEAMASGLPVLVSSRCGCAPELLRDGVNGFTFNPRDRNALTHLMTQLASGACDLQSMGEASSRIVENFAPESFGAGLAAAVGYARHSPTPAPGLFTRALFRALIHLH